jgi:filamentous hemagglutinin
METVSSHAGAGTVPITPAWLLHRQASGDETKPARTGFKTTYLVTHVAIEDQISPTSGALAQILSGGNMHMTVGQSLMNQYGNIIANGSLVIDGGAAITNEGATLYRSHTFDGTWRTYDGDVTAYTMPTLNEVIGTAAGTISGGKGVSITGRSFTNVDVTTGTAGNIRDSVNVVATGNNIATAASANHGNWVSSDYLLNQLAMDPSAPHKRLGDGFYEQKMVRDQLIELTGCAPATGESDDSRYKALLTSGVSFAQQFDLGPGIALTADQISRLTSDIVWIETETVMLPDGTVEQVLVPKVYLARAGNDAVKPGSALFHAERLYATGG